MEYNKTLFELAKTSKWSDFIDYLKKHEDVDVNFKDNNGNYLINYAILFNNIDAVSILIHKGTRLDITDNDGKSILFIPIKFQFMEILKLLLTFNKTTIGVSLIDMKDNNGNIPLHYAISFNDTSSVNILLEYGSNVNITDNVGNNALHLAIYRRSFEIAKTIIDQGININAKTKIGETALHIACNFEQVKIVELLLAKGAVTNIKDHNNEFTPLHYTVNLNNMALTKMLIEHGGNPNMQDAIGNTALHYVVIEENFEIFEYLMSSDSTKNSINVNLFNIDSKIPIQIVLNKISVQDDNLKKFVGSLIPGSNLNFQDQSRNAPIHYLSQNRLWEEFRSELSKKKLNIFLKNGEDRTPLSYVATSDVPVYTDMIIHSYSYVLRNYNFLWKEDWENVCKKELLKKDLGKLPKGDVDVISKEINVLTLKDTDDICVKLIEKKVKGMIKDQSSKCGYRSYPLKKHAKCIEIESASEDTEFCTYTGITLDILIGLIYLLKKHSVSCSVLSTEFMEHKDLCEYYETIGIITNTRCEFLNFEIVWIHKKIYFSNNFVDNFNKCVKGNKKRFIIIPLGIELKEGSHANYIIYDKTTKEVERFEPYGSSGPYMFDYNQNLLDNILENKFRSLDPEISYVSPKNFLPKIGFQFFESLETKKKRIGDPGGFCGLWSIWYTDMRMTYYDVGRTTMVNKMLKYIKSQNISFKNLIRNYSVNITTIRDKIFKKADITINDWINDQYTEKQLLLVVEEITKLVKETIQ